MVERGEKAWGQRGRLCQAVRWEAQSRKWGKGNERGCEAKDGHMHEEREQRVSRASNGLSKPVILYEAVGIFLPHWPCKE